MNNPTEVLFEIKEDIGGLRADVRASLKRMGDHEARLRNLETSEAKRMGVVATIAAVAGILTQFIPNLFKGHGN